MDKRPQKAPTRYGHREKFMSQQQGAIPDLLSNLPKSSKSQPTMSAGKKRTGEQHKEDGIVFINVDNAAAKQDEDGNLPTTDEILEKAQEMDCNAVFEIELRERGLTSLPNLKKFPKTRILDLSSNKIKRICYLFNIKDLRELKLYDNAIKIIEGLDDLKELNVLQLQYNEISAIGSGLTNLKKLRQLRLDSNRLRKIMLKELCPCVQLTTLDLSYNNLDSIDAVVSLSNLEELYATNNQIKVLPELGRCKKLMEVRVAYNQIADCQGLKGAINLRVLDLSHNQLFGLKTAGILSHLEYLNLTANYIQNVEKFAITFPNVDVLDLTGNRLENIEECMAMFAKMSALSELLLVNNPLSADLSPSLVASKLPALEMLDGQPLRRLTSAKRQPSGTPVMRPMSASTVISAKFVENQIAALRELMEPFEAKATSCYMNLRQSIDLLPSEPPSTARPVEVADSARPSSRCSRRTRIHDAQEFAKSMKFDQ